MQRIAIIGTTGSGKSALAENIGRKCSIPHIELDAFQWGPNWTPAPRDLFRQRLTIALRGERWVTSGNYSFARDLIWGSADTIIWLDYSLPIILWQLLTRTLRRLVRNEELWNGNRESWRTHFASRDSLFVWAFQTHAKNRAHYPIELASEPYRHFRLIRLYHPHETARWLKDLNCAST